MSSVLEVHCGALWRPVAKVNVLECFRGGFTTAHSPSRLKREPSGVSAVSSQRAEGPHDQFEARVVYVPQVDVFVCDLHGALSVDVQVWRGHQVHIETFWGKTQIFPFDPIFKVTFAPSERSD